MRARCEAEASPTGIEARKALYAADQQYNKDSGSLETRQAYERAFLKWRHVYDKYPILLGNGDSEDGLVLRIRRYFNVLGHLGERFDKDRFILKDVIEARDPDPPIR